MTRGKHATAYGAGYCKKSAGLLCQRVALQDALIAAPQGVWPVAVLCKGHEVSCRGLYDDLLRHA